MINSRYAQSIEMFKRAEQSIPMASQTFSKSFLQYPVGSSPLFIEKGKGATVWDIDGNEYIDFVNGLLCVLLGYQDPDVDQAVMNQINNGVTFSLPHKLETEVAEKIIKMIPCAEMVRFGKNGSDATAGAVRLARSITQKDYIVVCGYHGWQDWYIGSTTRDKGVPKVTKELTLTFQYNNLDSLKKLFQAYPNKIAAVIMEPMNVEYPKENFLNAVKEITHENKALLIFDEIITGFRFSNGGAQSIFNVTPDLATFGKGLANGYPLSVVCGAKKYMQAMEEIFFSFTFGGETLSLAAANAVLKKLNTLPVLDTIHKNGTYLINELKKMIDQHELATRLSIMGHPSWSFLSFKPCNSYSKIQLNSFLVQELFKQGILATGTHNMSYAHTKENIDFLLNVYDNVFFKIRKHLEKQTLMSEIIAPKIQNVFKVRDAS